MTAAIVGPRAMERLETQLGAVEMVLEEGLPDRTDEIVMPGTNVDPVHNLT